MSSAPTPFCAGVLDLARQQDAARTGSKGRLGENKLRELLEALLSQQIQKYGRFASGNNEAVDFVELLRLAHQHRLRLRVRPNVCCARQNRPAGREFLSSSSLFNLAGCAITRAAMPKRYSRASEKSERDWRAAPSQCLRKRAIYQPRVCSKSASAIPEMASPFIEPVICSLTSARTFGILVVRGRDHDGLGARLCLFALLRDSSDPAELRRLS